MSNEIMYHLIQDKNFLPKYITVVGMTYDATVDGFEIILSDAEIYNETDIDLFIKKLVSNSLPAPSSTEIPDPGRVSALGIPAKAPTNVVVVLDPKKKWQFRSGNPAVTSKKDYGGDNFGTWHVDDNGNVLNNFPDDCKIAYFSVVRRPKRGSLDAVQGFNFHLEIQQKNKKWVELSIDPDVPELGSEGFPTPLAPGLIGAGAARKNSIVVRSR